MIMQRIQYIQDSVDELKEMVKALDVRMRALENERVSCQAINQGKIDSAHNRLDTVCRRVSVIDGRVHTIEMKMPMVDELIGIKNKLFVMVAVSGFVGTAIGSLVIALVFEMMLGGM